MSKRKISEQQRRRIEQRQAKHQKQAHQPLPETADECLGPEQTGLVVACFGAEVLLETPEISESAATTTQHPCRLRQHLAVLVPGDEVIFRPGLAQHKGVVLAQKERRSLLYREDEKQGKRAVAANVDQVFITLAPEPEPAFELLDRYLVVCKALELSPCLIINKLDLLPEKKTRTRWLEQFEVYQQLNIPQITTSTKQQQGLVTLIEQLQGHTSVFVGQSGVGKSSLISALLPEVSIRVGALHEQARLGKHTTTTSRLYHLPQGGRLIDSPGVREFGIAHLTEADILAGFPEIESASKKCKFRDCAHDQEPLCAVRTALDEGKILPRRWETYMRLRS